MSRIQPSGPRNAKIAIVGEAPGKSEEMLGRPFVGASGQELSRMLEDAGIDMNSCYLTNVFFSRPPENKILSWCGSKKEVGGKAYAFSSIMQGKYLKPEHICDVHEQDLQGLLAEGVGTGPESWTVHSRLQAELRAVNPNIVLALGNVATWALLGTAGIKAIRGTVTECKLVPGLKVLPTYHPAMILRDWSARCVSVFDMQKAERESHYKEIRRPERTIWIEPTLPDLYLWRAKLSLAPLLSLDIETSRQMITCVGFAPSPSEAYVIPFADPRKPGYSYWPTAAQERTAWQLVRDLCGGPAIKLCQNGFYDIQYLWRAGCPVRNFSEDTMLGHHARYTELEKSLGFLGSIYTNEASWKLLRKRSDDQEKSDD